MSIRKHINIVLKQSWWVLLFILGCTVLYEQALRKWHEQYSRLHRTMTDLQQEKQQVLAHQEDLTRELNSQSDQAWIELTLMKGLGLVPEGQEKVFFNKKEPAP